MTYLAFVIFQKFPKKVGSQVPRFQPFFPTMDLHHLDSMVGTDLEFSPDKGLSDFMTQEGGMSYFTSLQ